MDAACQQLGEPVTDQEIVERFVQISEEFSKLHALYLAAPPEARGELLRRANRLTAAATMLCRMQQMRTKQLRDQFAN